MTRALAAVVLCVVVPSAFGRDAQTVPWRDACDHVGEVVTLEGDAVAARVEDGACILEFSDDPTAVRVVLVLGLLASPEARACRWGGRRVHVTGRLQRFGQRPEMIVRRADQIEADVAATPTPPPAPTTTMPAPRVAPVPAPPPPPAPPTPVPVAPPPPAAPRDACADARARVAAERQGLSSRTARLTECLAAGDASCHDERHAVASALEAVTRAERQADDACR